MQIADLHIATPVGHGVRAPTTTPARSPSPEGTGEMAPLQLDQFERSGASAGPSRAQPFALAAPRSLGQLAGTKRAAEGEHTQAAAPAERGRMRTAPSVPAEAFVGGPRATMEQLVRLATRDDVAAVHTLLPHGPSSLSADEKARLGHAAATNDGSRVLAFLIEGGLLEGDRDFAEDLWAVAALANNYAALGVLHRWKEASGTAAAQSAQSHF